MPTAKAPVAATASAGFILTFTTHLPIRWFSMTSVYPARTTLT